MPREARPGEGGRDAASGVDAADGAKRRPGASPAVRTEPGTTHRMNQQSIAAWGETMRGTVVVVVAAGAIGCLLASAPTAGAGERRRGRPRSAGDRSCANTATIGRALDELQRAYLIAHSPRAAAQLGFVGAGARHVAAGRGTRARSARRRQRPVDSQEPRDPARRRRRRFAPTSGGFTSRAESSGAQVRSTDSRSARCRCAMRSRSAPAPSTSRCVPPATSPRSRRSTSRRANTRASRSRCSRSRHRGRRHARYRRRRHGLRMSPPVTPLVAPVAGPGPSLTETATRRRAGPAHRGDRPRRGRRRGHRRRRRGVGRREEQVRRDRRGCRRRPPLQREQRELEDLRDRRRGAVCRGRRRGRGRRRPLCRGSAQGRGEAAARRSARSPCGRWSCRAGPGRPFR